MVMALSLALAVTFLSLGLMVVELWSFPRRRRRCTVNMFGETDASIIDDVIEGVLWTRRGHWLVIKDAVLQRRNGETSVIDGEVLIETRRVAFIQVR